MKGHDDMTTTRDYTRPPDGRYSVRLEWTGAPVRRYVVRFCGDWVGTADNETTALSIAHTHDAERMAKYRVRTGGTVALWIAGSNGKRIGALHTVRELRADGIVTRCGMVRGVWGVNLTARRTLAVPCTDDTRATCTRCAS